MNCTYTCKDREMMALVVLTTVILAIFSFINKYVLVSCFFLPTFVLLSHHALSFIITTSPLFGIITAPMKMKKIMEDEETGSGYEEDDDDDDDDMAEAEMVESEERNFKKIRLKLGSGSGGGGGGGGGGGRGGGQAAQPSCMVDKCEVDLRGCKNYYQRHKVCELHSKAPVVTISGIRQRFCQQCSRFHEVSEFDQSKRSCRARLAGHNERRRKSSSRLVKKPQIAKDSRSPSYKIDWMSPSP